MTPKRTRVTVRELREHVLALADAFNVDVVVQSMHRDEAMHCVAFDDATRTLIYRSIVIAPIDDAISYGIAMHELGHACALNGVVFEPQPQSSATKRIQEDAAYEWARHNAIIWTPAMEADARRARATYDDKVPPVYKPYEPPFAPYNHEQGTRRRDSLDAFLRRIKP